jgi:Xaa-Pro aminopeptidase
VSERLDRLTADVRERGLDALLVTDVVNVRYLSGFTGTNGACLVGEGVRGFLTDFRYVEQAAAEVPHMERATAGRDLLRDVADHVTAAGVRRLGFDDGHLTVRAHRRLRELLPDEVELVAAGAMVEDLRAVKDDREVRAIAAAAALATDVLELLRETGFRGRSEREVARNLEHEMRVRGAEPAFPTIVAGGPRGARPHADPGDAPLEAGSLVVVDLGCRIDGYCSDCTRTLAAGEPGVEAREVYDLVREAQAEALAAVHPGARNRAVDAVARDRIAAAGHGERFGHGLGHGVGMEVHEAPRLAQSADEEESLRAGNVVTVEPGVYVPGTFGVRIEDLVVVRDGGADVLTGFSKELVELDP